MKRTLAILFYVIAGISLFLNCSQGNPADNTSDSTPEPTTMNGPAPVYGEKYCDACIRQDASSANLPKNAGVLPTMADDEAFRMLSPNGGETYDHGDTITVEWLMNANLSDEAVVSVLNTGGFKSCDYTATESEWFVWPRDSGAHDLMGAGYGKLEMVNEAANIVKGTFYMEVKDTSIFYGFCTATFAGDGMKIRMWDPYGDAQCSPCLQGDYSDAAFSVNPLSSSIKNSP